MTPVRLAETCFRWLMRAYPSRFQQTRGLALFELFRDDARVAHAAGGAPALARVLFMAATDTARSAPGAWLGDRRSRGWLPSMGSWGGWGSDARVAVRQLRRSPGFVAAAAGMLAAGIGANITVFNLANAVLLRPLALVEPDRVVRVTGRLSNGLSTARFIAAEFDDIRARATVFSGVAALGQEAFVLGDGRAREEILGEIVSGDYLSLLGAHAVAGRVLGSDDDRPGAPPAVAIGEQLWRRRFAADPGVVGRTVLMNGVPRTIVGVVERAFNGAFVAAPVDAWTPMATSAHELGNDWRVDRSKRKLLVIARLRPGVSLERAEGELQPMVAAFADLSPAVRLQHVNVLPGTLVYGQQRRLATVFLSLLLGLVSLVLLVVCANVANLMLARLLGRRRELAIRAALGASRPQLVRLLALESLLITGIGAGAALLAAQWTTSVLAAIKPLPTLSLRFDTHLDWHVLAFTGAASALAAVIMIVAGTLQIARPNLRPALTEDSAGSIGHRSTNRLRGGLVALQVTVSLLLLTGAALFTRSVRNAEAIDLGFDTRDVVIADADHTGQTGDDAARAYFNDVLRRLQADPAVQAAAVASRAPLDSSTPITHVDPRNPIDVQRTATTATASVLVISPQYFEVVRTPLVAGRAFTLRDDDRAPRVAIVNETLAQRFWPGDSAIGKRLWHGERASSVPAIVVGVARNSRYVTLGEEGQAHVYLPFAQHPDEGMAVLARSADPPERSIARIQDALAAVSPLVQGFFPRTLMQHASVSLLPVRLAAELSRAVALLGSVLATIGLYALVAFLVSERTHELGVRMALGATPRALVGLVVRYGMTLAGIGLAVGLPVAFASTRLLRSLLYGVSPSDPLSFAGVAGLVFVMAIVACAGPAIRIARLDPLTALRQP